MRFFPVLALVFLTSATQLAYAQMPAADLIKGAKDHPLLTRFESAKLVGYDVKEFDESALPAGKIIRGKDNHAQFENSVNIEGKITRIAYNYPKDRSALEVMRSYQAAMEKAGVKPVFSCVKEACGSGFGGKILDRIGSRFIQGEKTWSPFNSGRDSSRYLLSTGVRSDGSQVYVALYVVQPVEPYNGGVYLEIVEPKPMDSGKVAASLAAEDMAKGIANEGKVAIYGVYFDTDKADIQPESKAALDEMAKLLQKDPALKVYIVGHTDSQGALAGNIALSQKRAEAVAKALSTEHKVDAKRLSAKGVASFAPVSSNDQEPGRVKNRRVELVKQ